MDYVLNVRHSHKIFSINKFKLIVHNKCYLCQERDRKHKHWWSIIHWNMTKTQRNAACAVK